MVWFDPADAWRDGGSRRLTGGERGMCPAASPARWPGRGQQFRRGPTISDEGGRFRAPLEKFPETLSAAIRLLNLQRFF